MRLGLGRRVQVLLALAVALVVGVGATGIVATRSLAGIVRQYSEREVPALHSLADLSASVGRASTVASAVENGLLDVAAHAAAREALVVQMKALQDAVEAYDDATEDGAAQAAVVAAVQEWRSHADALVDQARARDAVADRFAEAAAQQSKVTASYEDLRQDTVKVLEALASASAEVKAGADQVNARGQSLAAWANGSMVAALLLGAALLLLLGGPIVRGVRRGVAGLRGQAQALEAAVAAGRLGERAELDAVDPEFQPVLAGMNATMDAVQRPVAVAADYLGRVARGEIPPQLTEKWEGDFGAIEAALNGCISTLDGLLTDMDRMSRAQVAGDIEAFVDPARFQGAWRNLAGGVNAGVKLHVDAILEFLKVLEAYGSGDFAPRLRPFPGKQALANQVVDGVRDNLRAVAEQVQALTGAAVAGRLDARADAARFQGDWRKLVEGVNGTLDAVVGPLTVAARALERIAAGDVPAAITGQYQGEFARIRDSLNQCIAAVGRLVADADGLSRAAVAGQLSTRADASRHQGDFRRIVDGVNRTLDAVLAPVNEAAGALERLARRDLRARVQGDYQGDHARIQRAVNTTGEALEDALRQVAAAVEQVSSAASQIASSSQAVASGASEQASALTETSASLESVGGITQQAAASAQQASVLAVGARSAATDGTGAVDQLQDAMVKIKQSAEGTSQIIRDVSDIAFQTNLLALNAAVEAARAGEAGRGFAVVAEEVRSLALRAKEAATKTEELIRQSVKQAADGELAARQVAGKLGEIAQGVSKVTDIVAEIAAAAREQSAGIGQVASAIGEMDKVTQQNAASAEESSSAASELSSQAEELAAMVGTFQLEREGGRTPPPRKGARPQLAAAPERLAPPARPGGRARRDARDSAFPMDDDAEIRDF
ncbi:MAG: methyl-accepting chemotaxis protein [Anaeromyxobacter sp.]